MTRYLLYALLSAVVTTGCTETEGPDRDDEVRTEGYTLFSVSTEALLLAAGDGDPFERLWSQGDCIGLFGSERGANERYTLKRSGYETTRAEFYGPQVAGERIAAYYPYDAALQGEAGAIPLSLAPTQRYDAGRKAADQFLTYCPRTFAGMEDDGRLVLGYPLGMLAVQIRFDEPVTVTSLTLVSAARKLAGAGTVDEALALTLSEAGASGIVLDCSPGVLSRTDDAADGGSLYASYCFVLPPAEYADRDLTLEIRTLELAPISCTLRALAVCRISAADCTLTTAVVSAGPGGGFDTEIGYLEGSAIFRPALPEFDSEAGYLEPDPEVPEVGAGSFDTEEGYLDVQSHNTDRL